MYRGASMRGRSFGPRGGPPSMGYGRSMGGPRSFGPRSMGGPRSFGARSMRAAPRSMGSMGTMGARRPMGAMPAVGGARRRRYQKRSNTCAYIAVVLVAVVALSVIFRCQIVKKLPSLGGARFMVEQEGWLFCDACEHFPDDKVCSPCNLNPSLPRCLSDDSTHCRSYQYPSDECTCERFNDSLVGCQWTKCESKDVITRQDAIANARTLVDTTSIAIEHLHRNGGYPSKSNPKNNLNYRMDHFGGVISYAWQLPHTPNACEGGANTTLLMLHYFEPCDKMSLQPGDILVAYGYAVLFVEWVYEDGYGNPINKGERYKMIYGSQGSQKVVEATFEYPHILDTETGQYFIGADMQAFCVKPDCKSGQ